MLKLHTKIYLNLSFPQLSARYAALPADGIGLMRAEFLALSLGVHPNKLLAEGGAAKFIEVFSESLIAVARDFWPRPVTYRTLDLKSNEYRSLLGGDQFEEPEQNPMLGLRGCSRYLNDPEPFRLQLRAVRRAHATGQANIRLMLPFIRSVHELLACREIIRQEGLFEIGVPLWIMAEVPSVVLLIEKFLPLVDGVSIGTNDLTQLILGIDRDNHRLISLWDEGDEAVMRAIGEVIRACRVRGLECCVCGDAPSRRPEMIAPMLDLGLTSLSVSPEAFERTVAIVQKIEQCKGDGIN
jgi:pyruvate,water dikinase